MYFSTGAQLQAALSALPASKVGTYVAFDAFYYGATYMGAYSGTLTPIEHFVQIGAARGDKPNADFDPTFYANQYADLKGQGFDAADLIYHFVRYGLDEGRAQSTTYLNFDGEAYLAANPDVKTYVEDNLDQFGGSLTNGAIAHFVKFGEAEGRVSPGIVTGETFTLTTGADNIVGTAGNDTINALTVKADGTDATTLTAFDSIDGGAGNDTLNIFTKTGFNDGAFPANVTVKNVETINYNNANAGVAIDASNFVDATTINQIGFAAAVTELATGTTASFTDLTATALSVTAADAATSAAVALNAAKGVAVTNVATLAVDGAALNSVAVTGTIAQTTTVAGAPAASLALNVTLAEDVESATVNTAVKTALTIENALASTKNLTSIDASASTGDITYTSADTEVATIKTGAGNDDVVIRTVTSNVVGAVVNALVETGAGNDAIDVQTTGTGTTTVNAGDGDDVVTLTNGLNTATRIDGGAGSDAIELAGKTLVAEDYVLYGNAVSNVEKIEFTGATAAVVDASKLAEFGTFAFAGNATDSVTEASAAALETAFNLQAFSTGYKADSAADADTLTDAYGGNLSITQTGTGIIDAFAASAALAVKAGTAGNVFSIVTGDVQSLGITLTNGANSDTNPTADTLSSALVDVIGGENAALTSLTLSGNGSATVIGGAKLATIDASGLGGTLAYGATAGNVTGGLTFISDATVTESIKVGAGTDALIIASTYDKMDTITGFDAVKETNDFKSTTDVLNFAGVALDGLVTGEATKVTLSANATTLDLAFVEAAAADATLGGGDAVFFQFEGNTYLFSNQGTAALEAGDLAVKVVGLVDFADDWSVFTA
ncbi:hypothetical protein PA01_05285 [Azoarcus sp. PA01]|nr:hypothetical protein PA01_05285 [Azoarcus sp. PA01]